MSDLTFPSLIVDQDISQENILMNHHGKITHSDRFGVDEPPDFRSTFSVQVFNYGLRFFFVLLSRS
jgi:hypothetical protein